ncbi:acyltransferase family protein [Microbacterium phosphatis]|uniref:acyltransferase family protein n=1 Tax=Microbacterium phosphatis TaxID=3140248 RepID=UPI0031408052
MSTRHAVARAGFRFDIQGLRALAVVLVVLDHAFHTPAGGFVGVDVFYVISGFLITGLLLREVDRTGSISLRGFYARRIRRIVPAAATVLVVTVSVSFLVWYAPRAIQILIDAASALLFVSNWHFMAVGADYLQAQGPVSPVQHYWSLSIEEQFYAVWPILLLILFLTLRRRALVLIALAALALASMAYAAHATITDPVPAYFDTFGRAWELLLGGFVAFIGCAGDRVNVWVRHAVALGGLTAIVGSALVLQPTSPVPFPGVVPAVVGTAAVIWASAPAGRRSLLGNPVAQWLGDISYSLYLWHFPVLVIAAAVWGESFWTGLAATPIMLALAHFSYQLIERPVSRSAFLRDAARITNRRRFVPGDMAVGLAALSAIVVLSVAQLQGPAPLRTSAALADNLGVTQTHARELTMDPSKRDSEIETALAATQWPSGPAADLDSLYAIQLPTAMSTSGSGCLNPVASGGPYRFCGAHEHPDWMLVGDSVTLAWMPAISTYAAHRDAEVTGFGFGSCSLIDAPVTDAAGSQRFREQCAERRETMFNEIQARDPDVVFVSSSETAIGYLGLAPDQAAAEWQAAVGRTLDRLSSVPRVVVLTNPPLGKNPASCALRFSDPGACESKVTSAFERKANAERAAVAEAPNAVFIDTSEWFCADGRCPAFIGEHLVRADYSHITNATSESVGGLIESALR